MSVGDPIVLGGQVEFDQITAASEARDDAEFIERLRAGEAAAFDKLVAEHANEIYALLYRLVEDAEEARDLTQETFLQAYRAISAFRRESSLRTWLYRIAINQARNRHRWWRCRGRDETVSLDSINGFNEARASLNPNDNPEQVALAHERERALRNALHALNQRFREVIILRDIEGLSYEEIAAALGISVGTVKSRLARGRLELRRRLEGSFS
ncbi:sigma-70 family RNA polymerase sigma factor [Pyrinomonas methylaliphatogenes]|uniref:RNA polymerase sigma factor, sigma-70 family n=1 Tax=Pyrinomonas methylaliphatogenes TaxID=454194 RepID=A0A0B6WZF8_9BACT|nr:sigma-70 family RNA polymerase sigma factor [Pyrinomonas methylaliphatogenes]MBX5479884.1 sigma-70 family RNA polymerase sigma factor [Pyrinomonas methylaliphatogenes]CDM65555.1 RNA polymerase sigma factor, sigma-70 family [Pyrinomonas methylaliphatogenes]